MTDSDISFVTDKNGRKTHAIIPIEVYRQLVSLKSLLKYAAPIGEHEFYTLSIKNVTAKGYPLGSRSKPGFMVTRGSEAVLAPVSSIPEHVQCLREQFLGDGTLELDPVNNRFIFNKDTQFQSASTAAAVISGNVRNGLDVWINREGFSLKDSGYGIKKSSSRTPRK